jgi:dTDP-4-dehydrorhamnose 3,5-epimerase
MNVIDTKIQDVKIIEPRIFEDSRGYFSEIYKDDFFKSQVCDTVFIQDNEAKSTYGVLRGLHYQLDSYAQAKLVRVVYGKVLDVAVDIREGSPTLGKYVAVELSGDNKRQLFVPRGFAHGYLVLSDEVVFNYKVDNVYSPQSERSICYNDPELNINWGVDRDKMILSEKDLKAPLFKNAELFKCEISQQL